MVELVRWLRAELDYDERVARAAGGAAWEELPVSGWVHTSPLPSSEWQPSGYDHHVASAPSVEDRAHIVAHDPARVLREIDAKRRTLVRCEEAMLSASPMLVHFAKQTVWEMAQPYRDRPGLKEEWRP